MLIANNLAGAYAQGGHDAQALEVLRENLAALQAQYPDGHWRVGGAEQALGDALLRLDSIEGSLPHLQSAATMFERQLGPLNDWTSFASARVAVVRVLQGDTLEGQAFLDRLHAYLAGQELNVDQINLLERFLFTLNASGPVSEYARFRALHPDSVAVATGGAG